MQSPTESAYDPALTQIVLFHGASDAQRFAVRMIRKGYWFEHRAFAGGVTPRRFVISIGIDFQRDAKLFSGLSYSVPVRVPA